MSLLLLNHISCSTPITDRSGLGRWTWCAMDFDMNAGPAALTGSVRDLVKREAEA